MKDINIGDTLTCAETRKTFIAAQEGCTYNYATTSEDEVLSDEGVDIRQRRELLDRTLPFTGYLSCDGRHLTGWKGNVLGTVVDWAPCRLTRRSWTHGKDYRSVRVRDIHGAMWYGRGSPGIVINLRPCKG
jgi:hypothetical protein